ncbi:MAG: ABC transporter substrate-binding protein [Pirellulaceae bacterium]
MLLSTALLGGLLFCCGCGGPGAGGDTQTLIYGRGSDADRLDPVSTDNGESIKVIVNVFEPLVTYAEETTELVPGLAERWEQSDDGLTWTFHLRPDVKFHDGTPMNAEAVVFSFERMLQEDHPHVYTTARPYRPNYTMIERVEAVDDDTVQFTLKEPSAVFLANMAMFPASIVSPTAVKKLKESFTKQPVGTGPFRFKSWQKDQQLVLEANEDYWGEPAEVQRAVFVPVSDDETRRRQIALGEIHIADNLPPTVLDAVAKEPGIVTQHQPGLNVGYLTMQTTKPPLNNRKVRQAISKAIDKKTLVQQYYSGYARPAVNMMPYSMWGHHNALYDELVDTQYDPIEAKTLLEEAAAEEGFSLPLKLELSVMDRPRPYMQQPVETAAFIKDALRQIGIEVSVRPTPNARHFERLMSGDFELGLIGWSSDNNDPDNFLYTLVDQDNISEMGNNTSRFRSDELHALLTQAQHETDTAKREALYHQAQELIVKEAPVVPLVHTEVRIALRDNVKGYKLHPTSIVRLRRARLEAAK